MSTLEGCGSRRPKASKADEGIDGVLTVLRDLDLDTTLHTYHEHENTRLIIY